MKTDYEALLLEYKAKLDAKQNYLDHCLDQMMEISRADVAEFYRLREIVKEMEEDQK